MPTDGLHGHGTTLSGSVSGLIGQIMSIDQDGLEVDNIEISNMESEEKWKEFIGGMKDPGTLTFDLVYLKSVATTVLAAFGVSQDWTITIPDGSTFVANGYLRAGSLAIPFDDKVTQKCALKFSGKPVFTEG